MTKHFSLSILAILASFSVSAATLDVHGEIKVNGKTVIDDKGNLIQDKSDLINIDDYTNAAPNSIISLIAPANKDGIVSTYKITYDETGRTSQEDEYSDDKLRWSAKWENRTVSPLTQQRTIMNGWGNTTITTTYKDEFTTSSSYPLAQIGISMTRSDIYTSTVIASNQPDVIPGSKLQNMDYQTLAVVDKTSYKSESTTIEDCIIVLQDASWMQNAQVRTYCKDYGLVQFGDFKL